MRIFLDANILFSAAKSEGAIRRLLVELTEANHELCTSAYAYEEANRNLAQYPSGAKNLTSLMNLVAINPYESKSEEGVHRSNLPAKDLPILMAAVGSNCAYLLTGDKRHFGHLYGCEVNGVKIVSSHMIASELLNRRSQG